MGCAESYCEKEIIFLSLFCLLVTFSGARAWTTDVQCKINGPTYMKL